MTDFTYVSTWQGFAYVAFIIDVFAGVIVGWRVSTPMETAFVLDALERRCGPVAHPAPFITQTRGHNMCRWHTHSGLRMQSCWRQPAAQATNMTTRWRRVSTDFIKRR